MELSAVTPPVTPQTAKASAGPGGHGATVPLANSGLAPQDLIRLASTPPPPKNPPKVMTQAQYEGEVARKISQTAEKAREEAIRKGKVYQQGNKEIARQAAHVERHSQEHINRCNKLAEYKKLFGNDSQVPWRWRRSYEPENIEPEDAKTEETGLETMLNCRHAPSQVKWAMPVLMGVLEEITHKLDNPNLNLEGATDRMDTIVASGALDADIREFCAKYAHWFQWPVEWRLAHAFLGTAIQTAQHNHPWLGQRFSSRLTPEHMAASADL
jgi:hypothetical protein